MSDLRLRRFMFVVLAALGVAVFFSVPTLVEWSRGWVDFESGPEWLRQLYYSLIVDRFPVAAVLIALGVSWIPRLAERATRLLQPGDLVVAARGALSDAPSRAATKESRLGGLLLFALAQFTIPFLLFVHRVVQGTVLSYGWGWQMYS